MGNDKKGGSDKRPDKQKRSVLISDHPIFSKIKSDLPSKHKGKTFSAAKRFKWVEEKYKPLDKKYKLTAKLTVLLSAVFLSFFIFRDITDPFLDYREGQIAQRHLIAQSTIEFIDEVTTISKREAAVQAVLPVYDFDHRAIPKSIHNLRSAFRIIRLKFPTLTNSKSKEYIKSLKDEGESLTSFKSAKKIFSQTIERELNDNEFKSLIKLKFSYKTERTLVHLFSPLELKLIVASKVLLTSGNDRGITINHLNDPILQPREEIFKNLSSIIDVSNAREILLNSGKQIFLGSNAEFEIKALNVVSKLLIPNLTFNKQETEKRKDAVADELQPVMIKINKGETIVRYAETITKRHLTVLSYLEKLREDESSHIRFLFTVLLLSIIIYGLFVFTNGWSEPYKYTFKDICVFAILGSGAILTIKGLQFIAIEALLDQIPWIPLECYYFLVPVAAGPAIIRMITNKQPALIYTIVMAVVGGILLERNFFYACYVIASSLAAMSMAVRIKTRAVVYKMGILTGFVNVIVIICIVGSTRSGASLELLWQDITWIFWTGIASGILTSIVVVSFVPLIEYFFGHTTDLKLLELSAMNHPLLRDLMVKAPGTYHHSIIIGSLVEKAAEAIEANPLLARVMAYYHDVGKMERPLYFIENQAGGYNRHDALQPHMSAMIIREHVKKGQELGYKHRLPQPVIDAMSEHHGSSKITYFYNKAKSMSEDPESVLESDYQYDGINPQSKESALVMLGDVVEAATRSLADPTPLRLSNVVKNVLNKYFAEGHLSECNLTLKDLDQIADSFVEVLIGIYHARIDYGISVTRDVNRKSKKDESSDTKGNHGKQVNNKPTEEANIKHISEAVRSTGTRGNSSKKR